MRERLLQFTILLFAVLVGVFGTLYFTKDEGTIQTTAKNRNITIKEDNSITTAVEKVYDAVVVVEAFQRGQQTGSGSGFVYKKDGKYGYILTNYHVVDGTDEVKIVTMDGEEASAEYLGGDSYADIAVLRIDASSVLDVVSIGDNTDSKLGDTVFTVGTPVDSEYMGTVTKGILSGVNREVTVNASDGSSYMMEVLQTDASINPGNSGGPLVNINGEVIGITSMKLVTAEIEGMGFAIPIEIAMASTSKLEKGEKIERPYIGISLYDVTNTMMLYRNNIRLPENVKNGVVLADVESGSPADKAGLKTGDVITMVDGTKVKSTAHFKYLLYKHELGEKIPITINRNGKEENKTLELSRALGN